MVASVEWKRKQAREEESRTKRGEVKERGEESLQETVEADCSVQDEQQSMQNEQFVDTDAKSIAHHTHAHTHTGTRRQRETDRKTSTRISECKCAHEVQAGNGSRRRDLT